MDVGLVSFIFRNKDEFDETLKNLGKLFSENFDKYRSKASPETLAGGPRL